MKHFEVEYVHFQESHFHLSTRAVHFRTLWGARRWIRKNEDEGPVRINYVRTDYFQKGKVHRAVMYFRRPDGLWVTKSTRYPQALNLKTGKTYTVHQQVQQ